MDNKFLRHIFLGFIRIHILYHASQEPFFGVWMMEELKSHDYDISAGTLYPILHKMEENNLLTVEERVVEGKVRKYYSITEQGEEILQSAQEKTEELYKEVVAGEV